MLLCAGVGAPGPRPPPPLYIHFRAGRPALRRAALRSAAPQWCLVQRSALGDCCSSGSGTEEDSLPGAPARHGRPFLCEALMVTRWRAGRGGGGVLYAVRDLLDSFLLCLVIFQFQANCCPVIQD